MGGTRRAITAAAVAVMATLSVASGVAAAEDEPTPDPTPGPVADVPPAPPLEDGLQHNVTYRARVDGIARGALVTYRISDTQVNSADPTMLPGRVFETTGVLSDPKEAGMRISIQWPYSANLVCEILVDDQTVAAASQFIGPRLTPAKDDPDYGALICGAPLTNAAGSAPPPLPPEEPTVPLPGTAVEPPLN